MVCWYWSTTLKASLQIEKNNILAQIFHCAIGFEIFSKSSLSAIANDVNKGADRAVFAVGN